MEMEKKHILVIDDDLLLLKYMEQALIEFYKVSVTKNGKQALAFLKKGMIPDLILLDIDMPEMDGYDTLDQIRRIPDCSEIPVIFLTGYMDAEHEVRGLQSGGSDYVTKPFVREVLLARIRLHLQAREKQAGSRAEEVQIPGEIREKLTETELKVLEEVLKGKDNREIAEQLNYSYGYIKNLISLILAKVDVPNRRELRSRILEGRKSDL